MVYDRVRLLRYYLDERFHKNTRHSSRVSLSETLLLAFTWPSLSVLSVLYIVVAFTYLDIRLFLSKAARMFISLFRAGIFVCASAHSEELSCWEIQMSLSVFRFPAPYLFPMRKPWIKDLRPIGPEPSAPPFFILVVFPLKPKEGIIFIGWSIKNQSVISQLTAKNIILLYRSEMLERLYISAYFEMLERLLI